MAREIATPVSHAAGLPFYRNRQIQGTRTETRQGRHGRRTRLGEADVEVLCGTHILKGREAE